MKFMEISNGLSIYEHYKLDAEEENTPQKYFFIFNEKDLLLIDNEVPLLNSLISQGIRYKRRDLSSWRKSHPDNRLGQQPQILWKMRSRNHILTN